MFGMGFMEILLVVIVAIIALGPEKLPSTMVEIAKFFKKFKSGLEEAKSTIDSELNIHEMKNEAEKFRSSISEVKNVASIDIDELTSQKPKTQEKKAEENIQQIETKDIPQNESKQETVSFKNA